MHIRSLPLNEGNLSLCEPMWGDRDAYSDADFRILVASAGRLLAERRALGAIVLEGERPRAFGVSTFVLESTIDAYLAAPHPQLGRRVLLEAMTRSPGPVLDCVQIGHRNREGGLQLVVANTAYDPGAADPDGVVGELMAAFQHIHRGYRVARIINEVFGEPAIAVVTASASYQVRRIFEFPTPRGPLRSLLATLTRQQAALWKTPLLPMFVYNPPRIRFTEAQQELLAAALLGLTDEQLATRLGVPLATVKARWTRIHERVAITAPEILAGVQAAPQATGRRGVQTRHLVLQYVRENPSELTPYARTR